MSHQREKRASHAYLIFSLNVGGIVGNSFRYTKINQLQRVMDEDEIGRLEIGMHDFELMYSSHSLQHLDLLRINQGIISSKQCNLPAANSTAKSDNLEVDPCASPANAQNQSTLVQAPIYECVG